MRQSNREKFIIDELFTLSVTDMRESLKTQGLPTRGNKEELLGRLVTVRLGPPSAPALEYIRKKTKRRSDTP